MSLAYSLQEIPYVAITLMVAFTVHEFAHAYVAYLFGDATAKNQGRLTLNPISHLDPIGTILIFIAGFGWARPVPVNRFFFKKPRLAGVLVSIAGPISNFILAVIGYLVWYLMLTFGVTDRLSTHFFDFMNIFLGLNLSLLVFNLLPFPPLDGYRIIEDLVSSKWRAKLTQYEAYGSVIFLILVITPLDRYTIQPIFHTIVPMIASWLDQLFSSIFMM